MPESALLHALGRPRPPRSQAGEIARWSTVHCTPGTCLAHRPLSTIPPRRTCLARHPLLITPCAPHPKAGVSGDTSAVSLCVKPLCLSPQANLLLNSECLCKIADFGLARSLLQEMNTPHRYTTQIHHTDNVRPLPTLTTPNPYFLIPYGLLTIRLYPHRTSTSFLYRTQSCFACHANHGWHVMHRVAACDLRATPAASRLQTGDSAVATAVAQS